MFYSIEKEKIDLARNLNLTLKSGFTLYDSLISIEKNIKSEKFKNSLSKVCKKVEHGTSASEAFRSKERIFGNVFIGLIEAGESSGTLAENCEYLADWLEIEHDLKREVKASTLYPKIILMAATLMGFGLSFFVLPRLIPLFSSFELDLPMSTVVLMSITEFLQTHVLSVIIGLVIFMLVSTTLYRYQFVRLVVHTISLKVPILKGFIIDNQCTLFTKLFATLTSSGLYVDDSIEIIKKTISNERYRVALNEVHERVKKGTQLSVALGRYPKLFSDNMRSLISVGEKTGNIQETMEHLSDYYMKRVKNGTKKLPLIIEPILLILIGCMVGFVAISIVLPIYSLTSGLH